MKVEEIIYGKLRRAWACASNLDIPDLERMAHDAVEEIREEFRKAGVDVWPRWKGGEE